VIAMNIGENLKYIRIQKGKTQIEIAKIMGVQANTYNQYENNKRLPDIIKLTKLADYYFISLDILVGRMKISA
jgi:transcriptional regulator with XRE-family HTH domain